MIVMFVQSPGMHRVRPLLASLLVAASVLTIAAACSNRRPTTRNGSIAIVAGFYPLRFLAERIGGARVTVTDLTRPGAEPHDLEIGPKVAAEVHDAGLVVYLSGLQPAVDEVVQREAKGRAFDAAAVQPLKAAPSGDTVERPGGRDPHLWLDPIRFAAIADRLADRLSTMDAAHAEEFRTHVASLHAELDALDKSYAAGLATCQRREIVTSHAAFGYLSDRYHLEQVPLTGLSPDAEPAPGRLTEVAALARRRGVTTIFFETLVSPKIAQTIATEVGARADVLDPIEGVQAGSADDYLSIMRSNLGHLRTALGCT
jgi:zinc transport system substrate-binding protein